MCVAQANRRMVQDAWLQLDQIRRAGGAASVVLQVCLDEKKKRDWDTQYALHRRPYDFETHIKNRFHEDRAAAGLPPLNVVRVIMLRCHACASRKHDCQSASVVRLTEERGEHPQQVHNRNRGARRSDHEAEDAVVAEMAQRLTRQNKADGALGVGGGPWLCEEKKPRGCNCPGACVKTRAMIQELCERHLLDQQLDLNDFGTMTLRQLAQDRHFTFYIGYTSHPLYSSGWCREVER